MPLFIPSSKIIRTVGNNGTSSLALSSTEWFQMQNHVQAVLNLPFDMNSFETRYGDASSGLEMRDCFNAMRDLRSVMKSYGNPMQLRSKILKDPNFLAQDEMPVGDVYSSVVWTLQRAHLDAARLVSTLKSIPVLAKETSAVETVNGIKSLFMDTDQILDGLTDTYNNFGKLVKQLEELETKVQESEEAMRTYTERSSKTRTALDKEIGDLNADIKKLEKDRDEAYQKWLDLTIAAVAVTAIIAIVGVAVSVILAAPTAGAGTAIGAAVTSAAVAAAGAGLGIAAGNARSSYDNLVTKLENQNDLLKKRTAYRNDLGALDASMKFSLPASNGVVNQIKDLQAGWNSLISEIRFKVNDLTFSNLGASPWINVNEMNASANQWVAVDKAIKTFLVDSFVDYNLVEFGNKLPADDPNWLKNITKAA